MKKKVLSLTLALVMALALLPGSALAAEGTYVTTYQIYDMNGERLSEESFENYAYGWDADGNIYWPIAVKKDGKWGYMNDKGELVIDLQYENAKWFSEGLAAVKTNGKWGFIDETGKTVIQPAYDTAGNFDSNGCAFMGIGTSTLMQDFSGYYEEFEGKYGLIDRTGKVIVPAEYTAIPRLLGYKEDGTALYEVTKQEGSFEEGNARYYRGLMDQTGKTVLPAEYSSISMMENGYLKVGKDGSSGNSAWTNSIYGMADENGTLLLPVEYSSISLLDDSHVEVSKREEGTGEMGLGRTIYGLADLTGKMVAPVEYSKIKRLDDGLYTLTKKDGDSGKDQYTVVDSNGKTVVSGEGSPNYQGEGIFCIGERWVDMAVGQARELIYCDETGKEIQVPGGYYAGSCSEGLIGISPIDRLKSDVCKSFMDKTGKVVLTVNKGSMFTGGVADIWDFSDGLAAAKMWVVSGSGADEFWGYMDRTGKTVIPAEYDEVKSFENGLAKVRGEGTPGWGVINTEGKVVVPLEYSENAIKFVTTSSSYGGMTRALIQVQEGDKYSIYNGDGEKLASGSAYEYNLNPLSYGESVMAELSVDGGKLLLDSEGRKILDTVYGYIDRGDEAIIVNRTVDGESQYAAYSPEWKELVPFGRYSRITRSSGGLEFTENDQRGMMDLTGKVIVPAKYDSVRIDNKIATGEIWGEDMEKVQTTVYNMEGKEILPLGEYGVSGGADLIIVSTRQFVPPQVATENVQTVQVDGKDVSFVMYSPDNGGTNYVRLVDLAAMLSGTAAQFDVKWNAEKEQVELQAKSAYTAGAPGETPFHGEMTYESVSTPTYVNGEAKELEAIRFEYQNGGYTYYKLRDLGEALGFNVGWDNANERVYIESDKAYDPNN